MPSTLYVRVCESSIKTYKLNHAEISLVVFHFKFEFRDLEKLRSTGDDL